MAVPFASGGFLGFFCLRRKNQEYNSAHIQSETTKFWWFDTFIFPKKEEYL